MRDVSLAVAAGEFVALLGANGSGKTTLAKHLNGLLEPTGGGVRVNGRDTRPLRVAELARTVGYVFQNPDHQIFAATVEEEIALVCVARVTPAEVTERVNRASAILNLEAHLRLLPRCSGWAKDDKSPWPPCWRPTLRYRCWTSRPAAWMPQPEELIAAVTTFNRSGGTVILITHNMRLVAEYALCAVVMAGAGRV